MGEPIRETFRSVAGPELEKRLWLPDGQPKAVLQLVHGMAEHIGRYDAVARRMNEAGCAVVGHTHLGHGDMAEKPGYFAKENGWDALIQDTHALRLNTEAAYPGLPYFLLGHSMGSFVVRCYCLLHEAGLSGVILSGTGHFKPLILAAGSFIARLQCALGGESRPSTLLQRVSSAGYNKTYGQARTSFDWLSTDESVVDAYMADPYCGFPFTARAYQDLFNGLKRLYPGKLATMESDIPLLLISGDRDPVGDYGRGVRKVAEEFRAAGVKNVTVTLYEDNRHELFHDRDRQTVWNDLIKSLNL
ncbi:MAG: lysophospholipase [Clostridia bacterium]|nr:lysophospholipase [Clostridia bacterium]